MYDTYRGVNDKPGLVVQYPYYVTVEALHKMEFVLQQLELFHPQWYKQRRWESKAWTKNKFEALNSREQRHEVE